MRILTLQRCVIHLCTDPESEQVHYIIQSPAQDKGKAKETLETVKKSTYSTPAGKKASKASFVRQRDALAQQLVDELDEAVFKGLLPADLTIVWNGRLNTTAGRASWKK